MEVARGRVSERPFARTIFTIFSKQFTGELLLVDNGKRYGVVWQDGYIIAAESASPADTVGRIALTAQMASSTAIAQSLDQLAKRPGASQLEILANLCRWNPAQVEKLRHKVIAARAARLFALPDAQYTLTTTTTISTEHETAPIDALQTIYTGVRTHYPTARIEHELAAFLSRSVILADDAKGFLPRFGFELAELTVIEQLEQGGRSLEQIAFDTVSVDRHIVLSVGYSLIACDCLAPSDRARRRTSVPPPGVNPAMFPTQEAPRTMPGHSAPSPGNPARSDRGVRSPSMHDGSEFDGSARGPGTGTAVGVTRPSPAPAVSRPTQAPPNNLEGATVLRPNKPTSVPATRPGGPSIAPRPAGASIAPRPAASNTDSPTTRPSAPITAAMLNRGVASVTDAPTMRPSAPTTAAMLRASADEANAPTIRAKSTTGSGPHRAVSETGAPTNLAQGTSAETSSLSARNLHQQGTYPPSDPFENPGRAQSNTKPPLTHAAIAAANRIKRVSGGMTMPPNQPAGSNLSGPQPAVGNVNRAGRTSSPPSPTNAAANEVRTLIRTKLRELDGRADYFVLLSIPQSAKDPDIRTAYFTLAKKLHPDRLRALGVSDMATDAQRLFAHINQAFATLSNSVKKSEYLGVLAVGGEDALRKQQAEAEDLAAKIFGAEEAFLKGEMAMRRAHFPLAREQFKIALELNPNEAEHHAMLAWATWVEATDKNAIASGVMRLFGDAIKLNPQCLPAHFYKAMFDKQQNKEDMAIEGFRKVLQINPDHQEATLELKILLQRRGDKKGLFKKK